MENIAAAEERLTALNCGEGFWKKAWNWVVGIDLQAADEEIEEAFESAFRNEDETHRTAMRRLDGMFRDVEIADGYADRFTKWQDWWQEGAKELERHEEKFGRLVEAKARMHLLAYVRSQPFFIRPLLGGVMERTSGGHRK